MTEYVNQALQKISTSIKMSLTVTLVYYFICIEGVTEGKSGGKQKRD
jgi:hypothetical protein